MSQSYVTPQKLLPLLLDNLQDYALFVTDVQGDILTWNPTVARLLGYAEQEFLGQNSDIIFSAQDREKSAPAVQVQRATEAGRSEDERWYQRKDGSVFWGHAQTIAMRDENGELCGFTRILRDETQRKQAEEALQRARMQSEENSRIKDEFLATLSHELRSPLNAIMGWSNILRNNELDRDTQKQGLDTIERNAHSQTQLINDLLDASRNLTGKMRLDLTPTNLAEVVTNAIDTVMPSVEAKSIRLETLIEPAVGLISGDATRLGQALWHLLSNAIKFTPTKGRIFVSLKRVGAQVQVQIQDSGLGITPGFLPHVFERFRQADSTSTRAHGGVGLGLALVSDLIEAHGGTVVAASAGTGYGSTFTLSLPLLDARPVAPEPAPIASPPVAAGPPLSGLNILVVDDEADVRDLVVFVLKQRGAQIQAAGSARKAFALMEERAAQGKPFDALVSDIGMPGEDGCELINRIREREAEQGGFLPAIALTAYADAKSRQRALDAGFQVHLPKPVNMDELVATVTKLVKHNA